MPKIATNSDNAIGEVDDHALHHHTSLPHTATSLILDKFIDKLGAWTSWLWILTVGVILYSVISRYVFSQGSVTLEELQWHLAGAAWLIGLSYTLTHDDHVRVDIIHERLSNKRQVWIEFLGLSFLLIPFLLISIYELVPYAYASFEQQEHSASPNGLGQRWILKAVLALSFILILIASVARLIRTSSYLFNFPKAKKQKKNA